jgi:hypothetical protein
MEPTPKKGFVLPEELDPFHLFAAWQVSQVIDGIGDLIGGLVDGITSV